MKKLLFLTMVMLFSAVAFSQTVLYEDSFESYPVGSYIAVQNPDWWTTWSGSTGGVEDALVTSDQANTGTHAIQIDQIPYATGQTDLIWKLGDKVSGAYEANWYMYVPSGKTGYYNFQHYESPGIEWAIQVHFLLDGTGNLFAGASDPFLFTFDHDTWMHLEHIINLDDDVAEFYIDGVLIHTWQWSLQSFGDPGDKVLGGVDFFAGANDPDEDFYYVDDIEYIETAAATDPIIQVTPIFFNVVGTSGVITEKILNIGNIGYSDLTWEVHPIYDLDAVRASGVDISSTPGNTFKTLSPSLGPIADPNTKPGGPGPATEDEVLRWDDGVNYSAIGYNTAPIDVKIGARFPAGVTTPYAGMELTSVDVYINDNSIDYSLKIYGHGSAIAPGDVLHSQAFTPTPYSWNTIVLTDPVILTGEDIWITYQYTQNDLIFTAGCDDGPQNPNGDFISTGVGWGHLGAVGDPPYYPNWNIAGHLTGEPITQWLYPETTSGTLAPGESTQLTVYFDASELPQGVYSGKLLVRSNDPVTPQKFITSVFNVQASPLVPPSGLTAETDCQDIVLNWVAPGGMKAVLEGYNVYRDDVLVNADPITETMYVDEGMMPGTYSYHVKAVYDEGMSLSTDPASATVEAIDPINQLVIENEPGTPDVYLTWLPPGELPQWIHWDDGINYDAIGLNTGGTFDVAMRFDTDFLSDFEGMYLTRIAFFPNGELTSYALKVWWGTTLVVDQPVVPTVGNWNYIDLDTPVMIDASNELWIGYTCIDQPVNEWPAGNDNGPAVPGYGDMIRISPGGWQSMYSIDPVQFNLNWNIQGYVEWMDQANSPLVPLQEKVITNPANSQPVAGLLPHNPNASFSAPTRSLVGYNVWRNGEILTETPIMETSYEDLGLPNDTYEYCVTANYGGLCESEQVCGEESVVISVGMKEIDNSLISIYPNPSHGIVNIATNLQIKSIRMMNYTGQVVYSNSQVTTNELITINTSSLKKGIYFIVVETKDGSLAKKLTIQ